VGYPSTFPRSKHLNLSYKQAFGACEANQVIHIATQHIICEANQDAANQERENQTRGWGDASSGGGVVDELEKGGSEFAAGYAAARRD
jgi:hypothetical protein